MYFTPSVFHDLYQPSQCSKRVWLKANHPELAADDNDFRNLLVTRGNLLEEAHLSSFSDWHRPSYTNPWDGYRATMDLIKKRAPVIYQGVLIDQKNNLLGIPDFLILEQNGTYKLRESKLAVNLPAHPEISLQLGIYRIIAKEALGYEPDLEILCGNGQIVSKLLIPDEEEVFSAIEFYKSLQTGNEPEEPVSWSKCQQCVFRGYCWDGAIERRCVATIPSVDQGAAKRFWDLGVNTYEHLYEFSDELLVNTERPWGKGVQRIGATKGKKIKLEVQSLIIQQMNVLSRPSLPPGYSPGKRPVMMFDIENDVFDPELGVKVYLWGCLLITDEGIQEPALILAGKGIEGDRAGWFSFLEYTGQVLAQYGNIPFVHYSSHEQTWIKKYIERYGDPEGIASRVLNNLWDMYPAITRSIVLPLPSYGLKSVEKVAGFTRSQDEYGGLWSIITYDQYLYAATKEDADRIIEKIMIYNHEDILASYKVYEWLESISKDN